MNKKTLYYFMSVCCILIAAACTPDIIEENKQLPIGGKNYFIAVSGDDENPGTLESPWRSFSKALSEVLSGDTVFVREGTYSESFIVSLQATKENPIVFTNYQQECPILDGTNISLPDYLIGLVSIYESSHIEFDNFVIQNVSGNSNNCGILVESSQHIKVTNCQVKNTISSGIAVWDANDISIENNVVEKACNGGEQECITVANTDGFLVKNNTVKDGIKAIWGGEGIDAKDGSKNGLIVQNVVYDLDALGIYVDAWDKSTHNITIDANLVYSCNGDGIALASENGGDLSNILVTNNIVANNMLNGISIVNDGISSNHPISKVKIINNTIFNNGNSDWGGGIYTDNPSAHSIIFRNNIVSDNSYYQIALDVFDKSKFVIDHNLILGFRDYENEVKGVDFIEVNPLFIDPSTLNFNLDKNSPCIDSGNAEESPQFDYFNNSRPQRDGYDLGAIEKL